MNRIDAAMNRTLPSGAARAAFDEGGTARVARTPQQFAVFVEAEIAKYAEVIRRANIQLG